MNIKKKVEESNLQWVTQSLYYMYIMFLVKKY